MNNSNDIAIGMLTSEQYEDMQKQADKILGLKYDSGKPKVELVDPDFIEGVASVLTFGAEKYAAHNWRNGISTSRLIGAAYRHLGAFNKGEDLDPESGLPHVYHAACCLQFLGWMMQYKPEFDDRWKENGK